MALYMLCNASEVSSHSQSVEPLEPGDKADSYCHVIRFLIFSHIILSLSALTQSWLSLMLVGPWGGRADHSATCICGPLFGGTEAPQLFVIGGVNIKGKPMEDAWVLDMADEKWRSVCECVCV